jgi:hypothetical protein
VLTLLICRCPENAPGGGRNVSLRKYSAGGCLLQVDGLPFLFAQYQP